MNNKIVKYHNDVHTVSLREFNATELDVFVAILSAMRDTGEKKVTFKFDEIKELIQWKAKNNERFLSLLESTYNKLLRTFIKIGDNKNWISFVLFTKYIVSSDNNKVTISINPEFQYTLNVLTSNFTRFELGEFVSLKSTYAKEFYRRMKQFRNTGLWKVSLEEFRRVMGIPEKYKMDSIDKFVFTPIMTELGEKYNLKITKLFTNSGRGRPSVCGFEFSFSKDSDRNNDAEVFDAEVKVLPRKSKEAVPHKAPVTKASRKEQKHDMELNESIYLMRTLRVRDKKFKYNLNYLKIIDIDYSPENGVDVRVKNMDDDYINTMHFDSVRLLDKFFNEHVVS